MANAAEVPCSAGCMAYDQHGCRLIIALEKIASRLPAPGIHHPEPPKVR